MNPHILGECYQAGIFSDGPIGVLLVVGCNSTIRIDCQRELFKNIDDNIIYKYVRVYLEVNEDGSLRMKNGRFVGKKIELA